MMKYKFTVEIIGYGDNEKEAWDDAVEQFFLEPGVMPIPSICVPYLNKEKKEGAKNGHRNNRHDTKCNHDHNCNGCNHQELINIEKIKKRPD